jgi:hypothetical protein
MGSSIFPYGTPESTVASFDSSPSITTYIVLCVRNISNYLLSDSLTPCTRPVYIVVCCVARCRMLLKSSGLQRQFGCQHSTIS